MLFWKKHVLMDIYPDDWRYSGGYVNKTGVKNHQFKDLSLLEQLKQVKEGEKLKDKNNPKFLFKL